jgi:mono/diheme cytochrome c family protein
MAGLLAVAGCGDHEEKPRPASPVAQQPAGEPAGPPTLAAGSAAAGEISAEQALVRGGELFAKYCAICHGETGDGLGRLAYLMNPRPRNFQRGEFKLSTTENQIPSDDDLLRTLSRGMPGSAMPPWGHLPETDLRALVAQVRRFHVEATERDLAQWVAEGSITQEEVPEVLAERTQPGPQLAIPAEPAFDQVGWFRGRHLYLEACASCHGVDGHPVPGAVKFDDDGYPVPPRSFVNGIFKGGSESEQLYARVIKGLMGTPMPASEGVFSDDGEAWDLVHYVQTLAREGAQERAQLKKGTFVAKRIQGSLPPGPMDASWEQAGPLYVGLTPLWWVEDRIEGLVVQALHNGDELAIRLSWIDGSADDRAVRHHEFRDAVAIQFSLSDDPPFYMGDPTEHGGVNIWFWKADRHRNIVEGYQDVDSAFPDRVVDMYPERIHLASGSNPRGGAGSLKPAALTQHDPQFITAWGAGNLVADPTLKTAAESLVARGPGTLAARPGNVQSVESQAVYERGVWHVQLQRSMVPSAGQDLSDERLFKSGDHLPLSFAIWNGSAGDRDGKKNISIWQELVIE